METTGRDTAGQDGSRASPSNIGFGARAADAMAHFGGSWGFLGLFMGVLIAWIALNTISAVAFDPYPFILLNLVLSCVAAVQAPIIMMSQVRQNERDRAGVANDYEINQRSEAEVRDLRDALKALQEEHRELHAQQLDSLTTLTAELSAVRDAVMDRTRR